MTSTTYFHDILIVDRVKSTVGNVDIEPVAVPMYGTNAVLSVDPRKQSNTSYGTPLTVRLNRGYAEFNRE